MSSQQRLTFCMSSDDTRLRVPPLCLPWRSARWVFAFINVHVSVALWNMQLLEVKTRFVSLCFCGFIFYKQQHQCICRSWSCYNQCVQSSIRGDQYISDHFYKDDLSHTATVLWNNVVYTSCLQGDSGYSPHHILWRMVVKAVSKATRKRRL